MLTEKGKAKITRYLSTDDMVLKCLVKEIKSAENAGINNPGMKEYLTRVYISPAFIKAEERYNYLMQPQNIIVVVNNKEMVANE